MGIRAELVGAGSSHPFTDLPQASLLIIWVQGGPSMLGHRTSVCDTLGWGFGQPRRQSGKGRGKLLPAPDFLTRTLLPCTSPADCSRPSFLPLLSPGKCQLCCPSFPPGSDPPAPRPHSQLSPHLQAPAWFLHCAICCVHTYSHSLLVSATPPHLCPRDWLMGHQDVPSPPFCLSSGPQEGLGGGRTHRVWGMLQASRLFPSQRPHSD